MENGKKKRVCKPAPSNDLSGVLRNVKNAQTLSRLLFGDPIACIKELTDLRDELKAQCEAAKHLIAHVDALRKIEALASLALAWSGKHHPAHERGAGCFLCSIEELTGRIMETSQKARFSESVTVTVHTSVGQVKGNVGKINLDGGMFPD
jgi:hypothetical protein